MNFEKAIVPIKVKIPINRITSTYASVLCMIETTAVIEMRFIPMESRAMTRSDIEGPVMTRYRQASIDKDSIINTISSNESAIIGSPP
jgi:hypothetical protein